MVNPFDSSYKRVVGFLAIAVIALSVLFTTQLVQQSQDIRNRAQEIDGQAVATVGKESITTTQVDEQVERMYRVANAKENQKYRDAALEYLIRQRVVMLEAAKYAISIDRDELKAAVASNSAHSKVDNTSIIYEYLLEKKLEPYVVNSRVINKVTVYKSPELPDLDEEYKKARTSLELIRSRMTAGRSMKQAYDEAKKSPTFDTDITFFGEEFVTKTEKWDTETMKTLFNMGQNDISQVIQTPGSTLLLMQVLTANNMPYETFDDWYTETKAQLVKIL
jgi:hypothetical protein